MRTIHRENVTLLNGGWQCRLKFDGGPGPHFHMGPWPFFPVSIPPPNFCFRFLYVPNLLPTATRNYRLSDSWLHLSYWVHNATHWTQYSLTVWKCLLWYATMNYTLECICKLKFILNTLGLLNTILIVGCSVSKPGLGSWLHESLCMMSACDDQYLILIIITTWNSGNSHLLYWYKYSRLWVSRPNDAV